MPEYLSPGVYIEEVPSGPVPIQGVSTSTAGFVGVTERGPQQVKLVTSWSDFTRWYGGTPSDKETQTLGYLAWAVQGFFLNGGQRAFIARVPRQGSTAAPALASLGTNMPSVNAIGRGSFGKNIYVQLGRAGQYDSDKRPELFSLSVVYYRNGVKIAAADSTDPADPDMATNITNSSYVAPNAREYFDNLSTDPAASNYFQRVINNQSRLIQVPDNSIDTGGMKAALAALPANDPTARQKYLALTYTGTDGAALPALADYQGSGGAGVKPEDRTGLAALREIQDVNILCIPDCNATSGLSGLETDIVQQCESTGSRFGVLNFGPDDTNVTTMRPVSDTSYAAIYYPWLHVQDPSTGQLIKIPPCGHMAGVYARTDIDRGVHKAPGNEVVMGPVLSDIGGKGPLSPTVTGGQQDILNPRNVNCIRDFRNEGRGVRIWGARTMSSNGQWRYINVRRLFIFVEQSIERGTQWVVFEPNDDYTWERVKSSVSGFLNTVWRNGALFGLTPQEAYFVRCGRDTMTQDDIDNGRLICEVGIAPVKPAEFVIFRFQQKTALTEG